MSEENEWKEVGVQSGEVEYLKLTENQEVVGTYVAQGESKEFKTPQFFFDTDEGTRVCVSGSTVLTRKMKDVTVGSVVKVIYLGKKDNEDGSRQYKDYQVFVK
jgi:hypothetical protein